MHRLLTLLKSVPDRGNKRNSKTTVCNQSSKMYKVRRLRHKMQKRRNRRCLDESEKDNKEPQTTRQYLRVFMKRAISTLSAPVSVGPYSQAIVADDTLYASGQIGIDPKTGILVSGGIAEQTKQLMKNLGIILKKAGFSFDDVVKATCYLADMSDFSMFNEVYGAYFSLAPARSCVAVRALPKGALVEVDVIAVKTL